MGKVAASGKLLLSFKHTKQFVAGEFVKDVGSARDDHS